MKHLFPKLIFIIFLVIGISSFVFLKKTNVCLRKKKILGMSDLTRRWRTDSQTENHDYMLLLMKLKAR
jgi:hypothetical protein